MMAGSGVEVVTSCYSVLAFLVNCLNPSALMMQVVAKYSVERTEVVVLV